MPENGQTVLIQFTGRADGDITMAVGWAEFGHLYSWDDRISGYPDEVAWRPLPEPYRGEEA